jgi:hypothetical protein
VVAVRTPHPRSHRRGHWFDPSIAHRAEMPLTCVVRGILSFRACAMPSACPEGVGSQAQSDGRGCRQRCDAAGGRVAGEERAHVDSRWRRLPLRSGRRVWDRHHHSVPLHPRSPRRVLAEPKPGDAAGRAWLWAELGDGVATGRGPDEPRSRRSWWVTTTAAGPPCDRLSADVDHRVGADLPRAVIQRPNPLHGNRR